MLFLLMYETSHQGLTEFDICAAEYSWLISIALRVAHIVMSQIVICSMGILSQASQLFLACSEWKQILLMYVLFFFFSYDYLTTVFSYSSVLLSVAMQLLMCFS